MPTGICCIIFHVYKSIHPEVFFKKDVLRIDRQFTGEHPCKSVTSALLKSLFCMGKYVTYLQQNVIFREPIWRTVSVYRSKYRGYK